MATITIKYSELTTAAERAEKAAHDLSAYAQSLPRSVSHPLGSLEGGSSGNVSQVQALVDRKVRSLNNRAASYKSLSSSLCRFVEMAQNADKTVYNRIESVYRTRFDNLSFWQKCSAYTRRVINHTLGSTDIGCMFRKYVEARETTLEALKTLLTDAWNWFLHGDGKYIIRGLIDIASTVLAIVSIFVIGSMQALTPVGWLLIGAGMVVSALLAMKKGRDAGYSITNKILAVTKDHQNEPGVARYYGNIDGATAYADRRTTDSSRQSRERWLDFAETVGDAYLAFLGYFTATGPTGDSVLKLDKQTVVDNIIKDFGFDFDSKSKTWSFNPLKDGFFGFGKEGADKWDKLGSMVSLVSTVDYVGGIDGKFDEGDGAAFLDAIGKVIPGLGALGGVNDFYSFNESVTEAINIEKYCNEDGTINVTPSSVASMFSGEIMNGIDSGFSLLNNLMPKDEVQGGGGGSR